jgi:hypothetical protein
VPTQAQESPSPAAIPRPAEGPKASDGQKAPDVQKAPVVAGMTSTHGWLFLVVFNRDVFMSEQ